MDGPYDCLKRPPNEQYNIEHAYGRITHQNTNLGLDVKEQVASHGKVNLVSEAFDPERIYSEIQ